MNLHDCAEVGASVDVLGSSQCLLVCVDVAKDYMACIDYVVDRYGALLNSMHVHLLYNFNPRSHWKMMRLYTPRRMIAFHKARGCSLLENISYSLREKGAMVSHHVCSCDDLNDVASILEKYHFSEVVVCESRKSIFSSKRIFPVVLGGNVKTIESFA